VPAEEAERYFPHRGLSRRAYRARTEFVRPPRPMGAGETQVIELEVENRGDAWWPAGDDSPAIRVTHRWLGVGGSALGQASRTPLPETLAPGAKTRVLLVAEAPVWAGRHRLRVDLVHEGARWFDAAAEHVVEVRAALDRAKLGSPPPAPERGYAGEIGPAAERFAMEVGERSTLDVRVRNLGSRSWQSSGDGGPPVFLSSRWLDPGGTVVVSDAPRTPLVPPVAPGAERVVPLDHAAPVRPGDYTIEIDLVEEGVRWFGDPQPVSVQVSAPAEVRRRFDRAKRSSTGLKARLRRRRARSIPHAIHRVWLGDQPLPDEHRYYGETWTHHHPGWSLRLWGEREAARLIPASVRRLSRSHSETSNLMRYEILRRVGGIYADTDVECRRPFDPLLDGVDAFGAWESPFRVGSAVLGSVPGHPLFELAANEARVTIGRGINSVESNGPGFLTELIAERPSIAVFDTELFYPYRWDEPHRRNEPFPNSYTVHHWAKSWVGKSDGRAQPREGK
ncbi:MAG TPA: glycosyltransferase, partial [Thermoleophilaceae bacterium]|nr:glycosyltransferase [Thermoleophilaceae bacterium]